MLDWISNPVRSDKSFIMLFAISSLSSQSFLNLLSGTGQRIKTILNFPASAGNIAGLLLTKSGRLYMGDGSFSTPGVVIFDTTKADKPRLTQGNIDVGLRPFDLVELQ